MSLFIETARKEGLNGAHLYLLGVLASFLGGQIIGAIPLLYVMLSKGVFDASVMTNPSLLGLSNNEFISLAMFPFILSFVILWIFIKYVHKKRFLVSLTAFESFNWKKLFFSFFVWLAMSAIIDGTFYFMDPTNYEFHFAGKEFWILLAISLLIIPIQTSFEELLFRSYLMQSIGMISAYRIVPFMITSVAFGLMHIMNPEIGEYGYIVLIQYIGIGFLLGLLTILSDSTELALGLHAANNIYGSIFVSFKGSALTTDSLFYSKEMDVSLSSMLFSIAIMVLFYFIMNKKYKLLPLSALVEKHN